MALEDLFLDKMSAQAMKEKMMGEVTGMLGVMLLNLGKETGVWQAMRGGASVTTAKLAETAGLSERYLEELLRASSLHGYLKYTPGTTPESKSWDSGIAVMGDSFALSPEMEEVLFDEDSPNYYGHSLSLPMFFAGAPFEKLIQSFKDDSGVPYALYGKKFPDFIEKDHSKIYQTQIKEWLKNEDLKDLRSVLSKGGVVLDLGCGNGWSSISIAEEFPNTTVHAVDCDETSMEKANLNFAEAVSGKRVKANQIIPHCCFAHEANIPKGSVDLVMLFICLHDMYNPSEVLASAVDMLKPDGCILVLEFTNPDSFPDLMSSDSPQKGLTKFCMSVSVLHCLPVYKVGPVGTPSQAVGTCFSLNTMKKVAAKGGFNSVTSFAANEMMSLFVIKK